MASLLRSLSFTRRGAGTAWASADGAGHVSDASDDETLWGTLARVLHLPARVVIAGPSMLPTLSQGDRCLVRRTRSAKPGELIVFKDPEEPARLVVKRVVSITEGGIEVAGDNSLSSRDSRSFGFLAPQAVIGVATYRYAPAGRVGRLR
jgi:nickel-type superoxide dismutase maturation protease